MVSDTQNLDTSTRASDRLDDETTDISVSDVFPAVSIECEKARQYIERIADLLEMRSLIDPVNELKEIPPQYRYPLVQHLPALSRLHESLSQTLGSISISQEQLKAQEYSLPEEFEAALLTAADLRWLCNQCDYYFTKYSLNPAKRPAPQRRQWQIRAARRSLTYLKILSIVRRFITKRN